MLSRTTNTCETREVRQGLSQKPGMYQKATLSQPNGYSPLPVHQVYPVYGELPADVCCPYCLTRVLTVTTKHHGNLTYAAASLLCFMGCWLGCCLVPFLIDSCMDVIHTCPNCRAPLGKFNRLCWQRATPPVVISNVRFWKKSLLSYYFCKS